MSKTLEKKLVAYMLSNPDNIEQLTVVGKQFTDTVCRIIYTKVRQKFDKDKTTDHISPEAITIVYEANKDIFKMRDICSSKQAKEYIFEEYSFEDSFDWMFSESIIKREYKKRQYKKEFEIAIEKIDEKGIDTALNTLDTGLRNLDRENPRESAMTNANDFMKMYNERTKEIEELKKSDKPIYYTPSHKLVAKYARIKKGWFCNIISGTGGGKSIALVQEAVHHSKVYDERVLFITDENSPEVILNYMYCNYLGLKYHDIEDREVDLSKYIDSLSNKKRKELERVFTNIDVIELVGIPTGEVRKILKNAENHDNPYEWVGLDSFEEVNIDSDAKEIDRQNGNAVSLERLGKDFEVILWVTAQLKTELYRRSIENMPLTANYGSKTIIKKSFLSLIFWYEFDSTEDDKKELAFRGKINKCRSGGAGKIYDINDNYDYCELITYDEEIQSGVNTF